LALPGISGSCTDTVGLCPLWTSRWCRSVCAERKSAGIGKTRRSVACPAIGCGAVVKPRNATLADTSHSSGLLPLRARSRDKPRSCSGSALDGISGSCTERGGVSLLANAQGPAKWANLGNPTGFFPSEALALLYRTIRLHIGRADPPPAFAGAGLRADCAVGALPEEIGRRCRPYGKRAKGQCEEQGGAQTHDRFP
jgi:hypothetical protein